MVKINKNFLLLSSCAIALSLAVRNFSNGDNQSDTTKIVVANYEKLMKNLPEFEDTEKDFRNYITTQQEIQTKKIDALKARKEELKKIEKDLSEEEKKIRTDNIRREERELQESAIKFQGELQEKNAEGMRFLKEKLEKNYIDTYAKNNKIDLILDAEVCEKVYNRKCDITDDILALIKKNSKNSKNNSTAKK